MKNVRNIVKAVSFLFSFLFVLPLIGTFNDNEKELARKNETVETGSTVDIVIVGSGPAGLSAAIQGARSGFKTLVIEGSNPGGQLMLTTDIENFPGYSSNILGPDLISELRQQAKNFGSVFIRDSVSQINFSSLPYKVHTQGGDVFYAKSLIIATGVSSERLGLQGEDEYYGKGVSYDAISDCGLCKDRDVVIIGGGDSAIEYAAQVSPYAKKITVLVRSKKMRAALSSQENLKLLSNVFIKYNYLVKDIIGNKTHVTAVKVEDGISGKTYKLKTSNIFIAIGNEPNTGFLGESVDLNKNGYITLKGATQETSLPGVFAAGDVTADKVHLAPVAAGCGTQAGFEAVKFLLNNLDEEENKEADYIVCFCKGVSYSKIVKTIREGCTTFDSIQKKLGACTGCRACRERIESILKAELKKRTA